MMQNCFVQHDYVNFVLSLTYSVNDGVSNNYDRNIDEIVSLQMLHFYVAFGLTNSQV